MGWLVLIALVILSIVPIFCLTYPMFHRLKEDCVYRKGIKLGETDKPSLGISLGGKPLEVRALPRDEAVPLGEDASVGTEGKIVSEENSYIRKLHL